MRLYRAKVPSIANAVIASLNETGAIEVTAENRPEAEQDLVAIMEAFLNRDGELRAAVKDRMARHNIPYDRYGRTRSQMAESWGHPVGDDVERFLARQMVEGFMISNFVEEVYEEDSVIYKAILEILRDNDVDEAALREEAKTKIKNVREGTVDYEVAMQRAVREVKKRHGLLG
jgi:hypothetical protein